MQVETRRPRRKGGAQVEIV
ncbi:hypothetical protein LINGRAHAP2_LOCUS25153 [Linum grandiflorum]